MHIALPQISPRWAGPNGNSATHASSVLCRVRKLRPWLASQRTCILVAPTHIRRSKEAALANGGSMFEALRRHRPCGLSDRTPDQLSGNRIKMAQDKVASFCTRPSIGLILSKSQITPPTDVINKRQSAKYCTLFNETGFHKTYLSPRASDLQFHQNC
jgi:hypothetical protein